MLRPFGLQHGRGTACRLPDADDGGHHSIGYYRVEIDFGCKPTHSKIKKPGENPPKKVGFSLFFLGRIFWYPGNFFVKEGCL